MPDTNTFEFTPSQPRAAAAAQPSNVYLSEKQLTARFNVHRSSIRRWIIAGGFPAPVKFSDNCTRWRLDEVLAWEHSHAQARG